MEVGAELGLIGAWWPVAWPKVELGARAARQDQGPEAGRELISR